VKDGLNGKPTIQTPKETDFMPTSTQTASGDPEPASPAAGEATDQWPDDSIYKIVDAILACKQFSPGTPIGCSTADHDNAAFTIQAYVTQEVAQATHALRERAERAETKLRDAEERAKRGEAATALCKKLTEALREHLECMNEIAKIFGDEGKPKWIDEWVALVAESDAALDQRVKK
jgi:hypothetical protein